MEQSKQHVKVFLLAHKGPLDILDRLYLESKLGHCLRNGVRHRNIL